MIFAIKSLTPLGKAFGAVPEIPPTAAEQVPTWRGVPRSQTKPLVTVGLRVEVTPLTVHSHTVVIISQLDGHAAANTTEAVVGTNKVANKVPKTNIGKTFFIYKFILLFSDLYPVKCPFGAIFLKEKLFNRVNSYY
ncbi:MAG: hypothetical protein Q7R84_02980 [bacterium]|nr:hypothetical protein [bacterium]